MTARQQQAMAVFVREGYAPPGAAAIVGALSGESGVNLDSTIYRVHADHGSGGIAEWRLDRKTNLLTFLHSKGLPETDLEGQCLFVIKELTEGYKALNAELRAGKKTIQTMCYNFVGVFERPNMAVAHMDDIRVPQAIKVYNAYMAATHTSIPTVSKGAIVAGTVAGSVAVSTTSPTAAIVSGVLAAVFYLVSAIFIKPKPKTVAVPEALPVDATVIPAPSLLDVYKAKLDALHSAQAELDQAKKDLEAHVAEINATLNPGPTT